MILLTSTSDLIQAVTDSAAALKVHSTFLDNNAGTITPGRTNTAISSATTTTVVGSPGSSIQRSVRYVGFRNADASLTVNAKIQHTDGSTVVDLINATLLPGEQLNFNDGNGWEIVTAAGIIKSAFSPPILAGGTTSLPSLRYTTGTLETSALAGDREYDGVVFYATPLGSERGVEALEQFICLSAAYTLTSQTAAQKLFNAPSSGQLTVGGSRTYQFECQFDLTSMSASSGSFGFALGGTATFTNLAWQSLALKATTQTTAATAQTTYNTTAANTTIVTASTATAGIAFIKGILRVNAGGTIIPQVSLGVAAAAVVGVNSYFKLSPWGSNSVQSVGNWS